MDPFRERIEKLLATGKITPEEANKLLRSLDTQGEPVSSSTPLTGANVAAPTPQPAPQAAPQAAPVPPAPQAPKAEVPKPQASKPQTVKHFAGPIQKLSVQLSVGDVHITGKSGQTGVQNVGSSDVEFKQDGDTLHITSNKRLENPTELNWLDNVFSTIGRHLPSEIKLEIPENLTQLEVKSLAGDVDVRGVKSHVVLHLAAGDIDLHDATSFEINAKAGDVKVNTTLKNGTSSIQTLAGDVNVRLQPGSSVALTASNSAGNVSANGFVLTKSEKTVVGGNLEGRLGAANATLNCKLSAGDLDIEAIGGTTS